jgi:hypothetical protein
VADESRQARSRPALLGVVVERPGVLVALGALLAVAAFHLWVTPGNPPGFFRDEASISASAHALSESLRDERGALLPLYLVSFEDYKSPIFVYVLAAVFRVTGPHASVARELAAVSVLAAVVLLGLLAYRRTASGRVAVAVVVLAGITPWLYELGRVAFEVTMLPLFVCALLLLLDGAARAGRHTAPRALAVGVALAAITYSYAAGRLLGPLCAAALLVFAGRGRWRWLAVAWGTYLAALVPLGAYWVRHPGALTARYEATTFVTEGQSGLGVGWEAVRNYLTDVSLWRWMVDGDPKPYVHASDYGALPAAVVLLALAGAGVVLARQSGDRWWRYVLAVTVLAPIPAALTEDRLHQLRLAPLPMLLLVLGIPAIKLLLHPSRRAPALAAALGLCALTVVQTVHWLDKYRESGPGRVELFEAGVAPLMEQVFAPGAPVHVDFDDHQAQAHLRWGAVARGLPASRVVVLPDGGVPPDGALVFGRFQQCDYTCVEFARWGDYWLARAEVAAA